MPKWKKGISRIRAERVRNQMIRIDKKDYFQILDWAKKNFPEEACGLIGGIVENGDYIVKKVYLIENTDHSSEHFAMRPNDQLEAIKDMRKNNYILIGNFHSHPFTKSRMSEEDKRLAFDNKIKYLILSLEDYDNPVLNAFIVNNHQVIRNEIIKIEG